MARRRTQKLRQRSKSKMSRKLRGGVFSTLLSTIGWGPCRRKVETIIMDEEAAYGDAGWHAISKDSRERIRASFRKMRAEAQESDYYGTECPY
jgi:hypothetical protein